MSDWLRRRKLTLLTLASLVPSALLAFGQQATLLPPIPLESAADSKKVLRPILQSNAGTPQPRLMNLADYLSARPAGQLRNLTQVPQVAERSPFWLASEPQQSPSDIADLALPTFAAPDPPPRSTPSDLIPSTSTFERPSVETLLAPPTRALNAPNDIDKKGVQSNPAFPPWSIISQAASDQIAYAEAQAAPLVDPAARLVQYGSSDFLAAPLSSNPYDPIQEALVYRGRYAVPVQRPWVEFWRPFYAPGIYPPGSDALGKTNLLFPHFLVYGDYRTGVGINRNQAGNARSWANRLNLDMDLKLTATERIHGFVGPLDNNNQFTRIDFSSDQVEFEAELDMKPDTLFFEGDLGAIAGGMTGADSWFDLPFTLGLVPLLYQNGIWMEDAVVGAALAIPTRNSPALNWSNFDATFFVGLDQITSNAFQGNQSASQLFGTAWFIDAYDGYIEADYAFLRDDEERGRSYSNASLAFTRRYFARVSNSVRLIANFGQNGPTAQRTADGFLVVVENSLISATPNTFVPYANFFYGSGKPQSVARAVGSGGILRNTGINFETDGLTGYPTLDPTGFNSYGMALGLNMLGPNFRDQLVVEFAALGAYGNRSERTAPGDQYAAGARYQRPLTNAWLVRFDAMYGLLKNADDITGGRTELRWKF